MKKLFFYNDDLNDLSKCGSFTTASRELNQAAIEKKCFSGDLLSADYVIYLDAFDVDKKFADKQVIPYLVSEYNVAPTTCIERLKNIGSPLCFAISQQAKDSYVNAGYDKDKIHVVHLGTNPNRWPNLNKRNQLQDFIFLSHNTSNQRSGFEILIPVFLEFASKYPNVKLLIKDQANQPFYQMVKTLDKDNKILYVGDLLSYEQLVHLYNETRAHLYINEVTSFGMTILDSACTGLPQIVSNASAIKEFTSASTVGLVEGKEVDVYPYAMANWAGFGLKNNLLPLNQYSQPLKTFIPSEDSILENLNNIYSDYQYYLTKNEKFINMIKSKFTWQHSIDKIQKVLKS